MNVYRWSDVVESCVARYWMRAASPAQIEWNRDNVKPSELWVFGALIPRLVPQFSGELAVARYLHYKRVGLSMFDLSNVEHTGEYHDTIGYVIPETIPGDFRKWARSKKR